jgi:hypothetical protein
MNERILTVIIREGISYRNAHRVVVGGQRQTLAFLNFKTMQLEIRKGCPAELETEIRQHAETCKSRGGANAAKPN